MRILKYIFLLLLLAIIGISVYVATQKGDFVIEQSTVIKVPKEIVFNYVNDYRNWEEWGSWKEDDASMEFVYPDNTVGQGAFYSWKGSNGEGKMTTTFVKQNDSIAQKATSDSNEYASNITFKDTVGGTKVTWRSEGSVDFMSKVYATFSGGVNKMMNNMYERSLNNLKQVITKEINTFNVTVNGVVQKPATFYIKQTTTTKLKDMHSRLNPMLQKMIAFFKNNSISMNGKPFVIYESVDTQAGTITFSVCGPLKEEIYVTPGSDIIVGKLEAFSALKTTLTGDYSHRDEAIKKAKDHLSKNNIQQNTALKYIEVYVQTASEVKSPSKWVTEILIPVQSAVVVPVPVVVTPPVLSPEVITD
ncbi:SRPBCC family protein [Flavobacterium sp. PLA-1-15]|uniref:SRPBCC family protein n=1 Tax=Flavobacterium sp. PLA-1-15 TaxID=3380533 RepID=UPI003B812CBF